MYPPEYGTVLQVPSTSTSAWYEQRWYSYEQQSNKTRGRNERAGTS